MSSAEAIPLGPEDRAILALEGPTVVGHTCKVVLLGQGAPDVAGLRRRVAARLELAPVLTRRLGGTPQAPAWVPDPGFDVTRHVVASPVQGVVDRGGLPEVVARLFEEHLDRSRPLWRLDRVELQDGAAALVWRIHHALADGTTTVGLARALLWDHAEKAPTVPGPGGTSDQPAMPHQGDHERRRGHLAGFLRRELPLEARRSELEQAVGTRRQVAFAAVPLPALHDAARALAGATLNDAVLAVVAGGLRWWLEAHHGHLGSVRVRVPVSLHHEGDDPANRDSFFTLPLPLGEADPTARLGMIHAATSARKAGHDAEGLDALVREAAAVSPGLEKLVLTLEDAPRRFALTVSNVVGPREPVEVLGCPVHRLFSLAEVGRCHGLRVAVLSYAAMLCFGFCADPVLVEDLQAMADATMREADLLIAAHRSSSSLPGRGGEGNGGR